MGQFLIKGLECLYFYVWLEGWNGSCFYLVGRIRSSQPALMPLTPILWGMPIMHTTLLLPLSSPSIPFPTAAAYRHCCMLGECFSLQQGGCSLATATLIQIEGMLPKSNYH